MRKISSQHFVFLSPDYCLCTFGTSATISGDGGAMGDEVVDDEGYLGARVRAAIQSIAKKFNYLPFSIRHSRTETFFLGRISLWRLFHFFIQEKCQNILSLSTLDCCYYFSRLSTHDLHLPLCQHLPTSAHPLPHLQSTSRGVCRVAHSAPR